MGRLVIDAETYISAVADRIGFFDGRVYQAQVGPLPATVGHLYDTLVSGAGDHAHNVQVHFCVVLASLTSVDNPFVVHDFTRHVTAYAHHTSRGTPGFGTVEVGIAGMISPLVHQTAATAASAPPFSSSTGTSRPVVVDLSTGWVHTYTGSKFVAAALHSAANLRVRRLFPLPAELLPPPGHAPVG